MKKNLDLSIVIGFQDLLAISIGGIGIFMVWFISTNAYWVIPSFLVLFASVFLERKVQLFLILNSVCLYGCSRFGSPDFEGITLLDLFTFNYSQLISSNLVYAICLSYIHVVLMVSITFSIILVRNQNKQANATTLARVIILFSSLMVAVILGREMATSEVNAILQATSTFSTIFTLFLLISSTSYLIFSTTFLATFDIHVLMRRLNVKWMKGLKWNKKSQKEKSKKKVREGL
jgi:hypothetical protein